MSRDGEKAPTDVFETARGNAIGDLGMDSRQLGPMRAGAEMMRGVVAEVMEPSIESDVETIVAARLRISPCVATSLGG